jgi:dTDP-4-dehydrorhamnose reductase
MQAIREVNPAAQLVQTEDFGKIYSTPHMQYQADFENERRWLSWDLLTGRVDQRHRMWHHLQWAGISESELQWFLENPCPPDVFGINYYLTSERFLDERPETYPASCYGGNGRDCYADVEAVRVLTCEIQGPRGAMAEVWERYGRPLAITEAHLGCTREEQMRWLQEVWESAVSLYRTGVDVRAVTAWALLGSYDWDSMLTRFEGHYEPGVFDVRGGSPRPTALAAQLKAMAKGRAPEHPVLGTPGWWRRPKRVLYESQLEAYSSDSPADAMLRKTRKAAQRPLLITGSETPLGAVFARLCDHRHLNHVALTQQEMDITDPASVQEAIRHFRPWAIVNTAGYPHVGLASLEPERCYLESTAGPALLATLAEREHIQLLIISSDLVFNGRKLQPYVESDSCSPTNVYGISKARAEKSVLEIMPSALLVRTGPLFSPWDQNNFVTRVLRQLASGQSLTALDDVFVSPTYAPDLVHACLDLLIDGDTDIRHIANSGEVTWFQLAKMAAERANFDVSLVEGHSGRASNLPKGWPRYTVLSSERGQLLQSLECALECYFQDCSIDWADQIIETDGDAG